MRFFKKDFCVEDDPEDVASDWEGDDVDEDGPPPPHEPRLEVVSAEPREEGIAPSGITVGTAVAEPVVAEVEASPAVGERSGEESAQAESNPKAAKEGQFRNSCGICPTCCWRTSIQGHHLVREASPSAPAAPAYEDRTTQMTLAQYATAAGAGTGSAAAAETSTPRQEVAVHTCPTGLAPK